MDLIRIDTKFPVSKARILKEHGDIPVSYLWENDELVLLRDLLQFIKARSFKSETELKMAIRRAYRRYKME